MNTPASPISTLPNSSQNKPHITKIGNIANTANTANTLKESITEETESILTVEKKLEIPTTRFLCFSYNFNEIQRLDFLLDNISNSREIERFAIKSRYIHILRNIDSRARLYSRFYHGGHFIVTVGSLIVPALLSIQFTSTNSLSQTQFQEIIYWTTWVLSLMVTIANGILTLFKVDKKYNSLQIMLQKLKSEGYQFVSLTGRYSHKSHGTNYNPYDLQLNMFSYQVEKIIQKQIDDEYYKTLDGLPNTTNSQKSTDGIKNEEKHAYTIQEPTENVSNTPEIQDTSASTPTPSDSKKNISKIENAVKKYIHSSSSNFSDQNSNRNTQNDIEMGIKKSRPIVLSAMSKRN